MAKYKIKYKTKEGDEVEEVREVPDKFTLYRDMRVKEQTLITVADVNEKKMMPKFNFKVSFGGIKMRDRISFAKNFGSMLNAGLPMARALSVMERQTRGKRLKSIYVDLNSEINKGKSLSDAMNGYPEMFTPLFVSMVRAGEESGSIYDALKVVAVQLEQTSMLQKKVRGAMYYPAIIVIAMIIITAVMLIYVIPTLASTFEELGADLPVTTRIMIGVSNFMKDNIIITALSFIIFISSIVVFLKTKFGKNAFYFAILHVPVINTLVKYTNSARTARTLSSLMSAGVEIVTAFNIAEGVVQNSYYKEVIVRAGETIQKGKKISTIFQEAEHVFPAFVSEMVAVGEETGDLPHMLMEIAEFYEEEVTQKTKDMSTIIEPFLMIMVGGVVAFFALSMISPVYQLSSSF